MPSPIAGALLEGATAALGALRDGLNAGVNTLVAAAQYFPVLPTVPKPPGLLGNYGVSALAADEFFRTFEPSLSNTGWETYVSDSVDLEEMLDEYAEFDIYGTDQLLEGIRRDVTNLLDFSEEEIDETEPDPADEEEGGLGDTVVDGLSNIGSSIWGAVTSAGQALEHLAGDAGDAYEEGFDQLVDNLGLIVIDGQVIDPNNLRPIPTHPDFLVAGTGLTQMHYQVALLHKRKIAEEAQAQRDESDKRLGEMAAASVIPWITNWEKESNFPSQDEFVAELVDNARQQYMDELFGAGGSGALTSAQQAELEMRLKSAERDATTVYKHLRKVQQKLERYIRPNSSFTKSAKFKMPPLDLAAARQLLDNLRAEYTNSPLLEALANIAAYDPDLMASVLKLEVDMMMLPPPLPDNYDSIMNNGASIGGAPEQSWLGQSWTSIRANWQTGEFIPHPRDYQVIRIGDNVYVASNNDGYVSWFFGNLYHVVGKPIYQAGKFVVYDAPKFSYYDGPRNGYEFIRDPRGTVLKLSQIPEGWDALPDHRKQDTVVHIAVMFVGGSIVSGESSLSMQLQKIANRQMTQAEWGVYARQARIYAQGGAGTAANRGFELLTLRKLAPRAGATSPGAAVRGRVGGQFDEYMHFRNQGFTPAQAKYLTQPYGSRTGHHFPFLNG